MRKYVGDKLVEITCNKCGKTEDVSNDEHGWGAEPFREIDFVYGYGSVLYDFSGVRFDLCEHCVEEYVNTFKVPAEVRDYEIKQGYNSEDRPFLYYQFKGDKNLTQEELDVIFESVLEGEE